MQITVRRAISVTISGCVDGLEFLTGIATELSSHLHDVGERSLVDSQLTAILSELRGRRLPGHPATCPAEGVLAAQLSDTMHLAASDTMRRHVLGSASATVVKGVRTIVPKCSLRQLMVQVLIGYWQSMQIDQQVTDDMRERRQLLRDGSNTKYFVPTPDGTYEVLVSRPG